MHSNPRTNNFRMGIEPNIQDNVLKEVWLPLKWARKDKDAFVSLKSILTMMMVKSGLFITESFVF